MLSNPFGRSSAPIGVDVGRHGVKLAQWDRPGGGRLLASASRALPAGMSPRDESYHQWVTAAVKQALESAPFRGRRCVSALPGSAMFVKSVRLPRMPLDELREAVRFEVRDRLPTTEPVTIQFLTAGMVRQGDDEREEIIVLAAPTAFLEKHTASLVGAGLRPVAIDASACALARVAGREFEGSDGAARVVLDLGYDTTKVTILRGGRVLFFKPIDVAGRHLDEELANHLSLERAEASEFRRGGGNPADRAGGVVAGSAMGASVQRALREAVRPLMVELCREIDLCLRYYGVTFRGERPAVLEAVGGEALSHAAVEMLAEQSGLRVSPLVWSGDDPALAVAAGLSMRNEQGWGERREADRRAA